MSSVDPASKLGSDLRLAWRLALRDVLHRYANSFGGAAWAIGVPLLYAGVTAVVFSVIMRGQLGEGYGNVPFPVFYFVPFSLWSFFADMTSRSAGILREYEYLISKIAFPIWIIPLIPLAAATISQLVMLCMATALILAFGVPVSGPLAVYLLAWISVVILSIGFAYAVSAIALFVPDVAQLVPVGMNILFWLTPIVYPSTLVELSAPDWLAAIILKINPFYYLVETARYAFFGSPDLPWLGLLATFFLGGGTVVAGGLLYSKLMRNFADVL